jgi:hypothetical protein
MMRRAEKTKLLCLGGLMVSSMLTIAGAFYGGQFLIDSFVEPAGNLTMSQVREDFFLAFLIIASAGFLTSLVWVVLAAFSLKIVKPDHVSRRLTWTILGLISISVAVLASIVFAESVGRGTVVWVLVLNLSALLIYYLPSLFSTPPAFKHIPFGGSRIRF